MKRTEREETSLPWNTFKKFALSKKTDHEEDEVIVVLDQKIGSDLLKLKYTADLLMIELFTGEFKFIAEFVGQHIIKDLNLLSMLKKRWKLSSNPKKELWGESPFIDYISLFKNNREYCLNLAKRKPDQYKYMSEEFRSDPEILLAAIPFDPSIFQFASTTLTNDKEFVKKAIQVAPLVFVHITSFYIRHNDEVVAKFLESGMSSNTDLHIHLTQFRNNNKVFLAAVSGIGKKQTNSFNFELTDLKQVIQLHIHDSASYTQDPDICRELLRTKMINQELLSPDVIEKLKSDKEFILRVLEGNGEYLSMISDELSKDKAFIMEALKRNCIVVFNYFEEIIVNDKDLFLAASELNPKIFSHFPDKWKNDRLFILKFNSDRFVKYYSDSMRNDKELMMKKIRQFGPNLKFASDSLRNDKEVVMQAVSEHGDSIQFASEKLRGDREIVFKALSTNANSIHFMPKHIRNDKEILKYTFKQEYLSKPPSIPLEFGMDNDFRALLYIQNPDRYRNLETDREVMMKVAKDFTEYAIEQNVKISNHSVIFEVVKTNPKCLSLCKKIDSAVIINAGFHNFECLKYVDKSLLDPYLLHELFFECLENRLQTRNLSRFYNYIAQTIDFINPIDRKNIPIYHNMVYQPIFQPTYCEYEEDEDEEDEEEDAWL